MIGSPLRALERQILHLAEPVSGWRLGLDSRYLIVRENSAQAGIFGNRVNPLSCLLDRRLGMARRLPLTLDHKRTEASATV